ncbi:MAG: methyltransferase domain-containing protein [Acidimicrobiales bacterium]|nr:methyltransferase domain-containing protein [Acidimicrobiales bacterium]
MTERWTSLHRSTTAGSLASSWNDGYMVDSVYTPGMMSDLTPTWLSAAAVLHGQPPLRRVDGRPLRWLDLGTGLGTSAAMVAAANPNIEVWGFDYNPAHVDAGQTLASRAGLGNCHFHEASFETLAGDLTIGPDEVDVVVVNGVYSWISKHNQRQIASIIRQRLRPGGFAYIMYEVPLGWASLSPVTEALRLHAAASRRHPVPAFADAAAAVAQLAELGAKTFPLPPAEAERMQNWSSANGFYAAHEYLGSNFGPLMLYEVARTMADARCSLVGTTNVLSAFQYNWMSEELRAMFSEVQDPILSEMLHDVFGERALRADLYRRGLASPTNQEIQEWSRDLEMVGLSRDLEDKPVGMLVGGVTLDASYHQPLIDAMAQGPLDAEAIMGIHPEWTWRDAVTAMALQIGGGYAAPSVRGAPTAEVIEASRRLNEVIFADNRNGVGHSYLVAPKLGSSINIDSIELIAIDAIRSLARGGGEVGAGEVGVGEVGGAGEVGAGEVGVGEVADAVAAELNRLGHFVREDGKLLKDPDEARPVIEKRSEHALKLSKDLLPRLGIV